MYKDIFFCLFLAALCANSMTQPLASKADVSERYVKGMSPQARATMGNFANVALDSLARRSTVNPKTIAAVFNKMRAGVALTPEEKNIVDKYILRNG
ncbi:hypothetical protein XELAEV_18033208mg [Xenopus laevis]|uniref:Uncharacterized protein n=1 Tax=Xenopus laevis TaxID=8355 RepID=A0A974CKC2_XENLA|nr:hypothetical protein XELAEV_18033208mg [Xenopus laevis]